MRLGLQTNNAYGPADWALIRPHLDEPPNFTSAKLYQTEGTKHNEQEVGTLRQLGITHFVLRLSETIYAPDEEHPQPWKRDPIGYAEDCLRLISRFVKVGVYDYILGPNEPNIYYASTGTTPTKHAEYSGVVLSHMKSRKMRDGFDLPEGVRLGLAPIAWIDEYPHMPWLDALKDVMKKSDILWAHTYWQSSRVGRANILQGPLASERFGTNYKFYMREWPGIPVGCPEWASSIHLVLLPGTEIPMFSPPQVETFRLEQYPIWLELAEEAGVEQGHIFISQGATEDWNGYKPSSQLASIMAHSLVTAKQPPSSRVLGGGRVAG